VLLAAFKIQLGDLPTWLGVILAAVGGVVAYLLYIRETRRDERAAAERRERDAEARRAQAALVSAWHETEIRSVRSLKHPRSKPLPTAVDGAQVRNASELPVYDVAIDFYAIDGDKMLDVGEISKRVIPPGTVFVDAPPEFTIGTEQIEEFAVAISFRDAAGRRWTRYANGILDEDPDRYLPRPAMPHGLQPPGARRIRHIGLTTAALAVIGVATLLLLA
jgi:arabinogalactan oligomer/maltooligosaccharide transport system substrate-binding protein